MDREGHSIRIIRYLPAFALAVIAGPVVAQPSFYVGGGAAYSQVDASLSDFSALDDGSIVAAELDDTDTGLRVLAGVRINQYLGVEFGYSEPGELTVGAVSDGTGFVYAPGAVTYTAEASAWS